MTSRAPWLLPVVVLACGSDGPAVGAPLALHPVASGLDQPVLVTAPPGDPRLFVVEQTGRVRVVRDGVLQPGAFLDVSDRVTTRHSEQGLLGMAFHPEYATTGRLFVNYTRKPDGATVIAEARALGGSDQADPATLRDLLVIPQPYANHDGGNLLFGPDGYLYVGMGDGGSANDPDGNAQDPSRLLGKMLRLDVSADPYGVPPTNPFVGVTGARPEVWAIGLRNPWRFSFDRATGDLYIGDVGQFAWEEVHVQPAGTGAGANYGWNRLEGTHCVERECTPVGTELPVIEYPHTQGCSITGGVVYRGAAIPSLVGTYLYADYCQDWIRTFRYVGGAATDPGDLTSDLDPGHRLLKGVSSFGEDAAGEVYVVSHRNGVVYRIVAE